MFPNVSHQQLQHDEEEEAYQQPANTRITEVDARKRYMTNVYNHFAVTHATHSTYEQPNRGFRSRVFERTAKATTPNFESPAYRKLLRNTMSDKHDTSRGGGAGEEEDRIITKARRRRMVELRKEQEMREVAIKVAKKKQRSPQRGRNKGAAALSPAVKQNTSKNEQQKEEGEERQASHQVPEICGFHDVISSPHRSKSIKLRQERLKQRQQDLNEAMVMLGPQQHQQQQHDTAADGMLVALRSSSKKLRDDAKWKENNDDDDDDDASTSSGDSDSSGSSGSSGTSSYDSDSGSSDSEESLALSSIDAQEEEEQGQEKAAAAATAAAKGREGEFGAMDPDLEGGNTSVTSPQKSVLDGVGTDDWKGKNKKKKKKKQKKEDEKQQRSQQQVSLPTIPSTTTTTTATTTTPAIAITTTKAGPLPLQKRESGPRQPPTLTTSKKQNMIALSQYFEDAPLMLLPVANEEEGAEFDVRSAMPLTHAYNHLVRQRRDMDVDYRGRCLWSRQGQRQQQQSGQRRGGGGGGQSRNMSLSLFENGEEGTTPQSVARGDDATALQDLWGIEDARELRRSASLPLSRTPTQQGLRAGTPSGEEEEKDDARAAAALAAPLLFTTASTSAFFENPYGRDTSPALQQLVRVPQHDDQGKSERSGEQQHQQKGDDNNDGGEAANNDDDDDEEAGFSSFSLPGKLVRFNQHLNTNANTTTNTKGTATGSATTAAGAAAGGLRRARSILDRRRASHRRSSSSHQLRSLNDSNINEGEGDDDGTATHFSRETTHESQACHRYVIEYTLRPHIRHSAPHHHLEHLLGQFRKYVHHLESGERGGHFVSLSCYEPLQGLKALHSFLRTVARGESRYIIAAFVAHKPYVEGAMLLESPRELDYLVLEAKNGNGNAEDQLPGEEHRCPEAERQQMIADIISEREAKGKEEATILANFFAERRRAGSLHDDIPEEIARLLRKHAAFVADGDETEGAEGAEGISGYSMEVIVLAKEMGLSDLRQAMALLATIKRHYIVLPKPQEMEEANRSSMIESDNNVALLAIDGGAGGGSSNNSVADTTLAAQQRSRIAQGLLSMDEKNSMMANRSPTSSNSDLIAAAATPTPLSLDAAAEEAEKEKSSQEGGDQEEEEEEQEQEELPKKKTIYDDASDDPMFLRYVSATKGASRLAIIVCVSHFDDPYVKALPNVERDAAVLQERLNDVGVVTIMMKSVPQEDATAEGGGGGGDNTKNDQQQRQQQSDGEEEEGEDSETPYFLAATTINVKNVFKAFLRVVPHKNAVLMLYILSRGYCGKVGDLDGEVEVVLMQDSRLDNLRPEKNALIPVRLASTTDCTGKLPFVYVDAWELPRIPFVKQCPSPGYCWLTAALEDDGGNELLAKYPENASGGLGTYYLLRGLEGRALLGGTAMTLSVNALLWYLQPRLNARGCQTQHNAIVPRMYSVFFPMFSFEKMHHGCGTVHELKEKLNLRLLRESEEKARINVRVAYRVHEERNSFNCNSVVYMGFLVKAMHRVLYPTKSTKRIFNAKLRQSKRSKHGKLALCNYVERRNHLLVEYRDTEQFVNKRTDKKWAFYDKDFERIMSGADTVVDDEADAQAAAAARQLQAALQKGQTNIHVTPRQKARSRSLAPRSTARVLDNVKEGDDLAADINNSDNIITSNDNLSILLLLSSQFVEFHFFGEFARHQQQYVMHVMRLANGDILEGGHASSSSPTAGTAQQQQQQHQRPVLSPPRRSPGAVSFAARRSPPKADPQSPSKATSTQRAGLHSAFGDSAFGRLATSTTRGGASSSSPSFSSPAAAPAQSTAVSSIAISAATRTHRMHINRPPTRIFGIIDIAFSGSMREYRKLDRMLRLQSILRNAVILNVERDPFDPADHAVAEAIQKIYRGHLVRRVLREQREVTSDQVRDRNVIDALYESSTTKMQDMLFADRFQCYIWMERADRYEVEQFEHLFYMELVKLHATVLSAREEHARRNILLREEVELVPVAQYGRRTAIEAQALALIKLYRIMNWFLAGALWDRYYVTLAWFQQALQLRISFKDNIVGDFKIGHMIEGSVVPPSTDFHNAHTCIHSILAEQKTASARLAKTLRSFAPKDSELASSEEQESPKKRKGENAFL